MRFPDSSVLAAVAQRAVVTTLVTNEGRSLTEIKLTLKNKSQPFLKVGLPTGATILSAEIAGEKVKPVEGADGNRVPLLRPGFRPADAYTISFVFLHAGLPFAKKGGAELTLPKMDIPLGLLEWEVFLPAQYKIADFGGNALQARLLPAAAEEELREDNIVSGVFDGANRFRRTDGTSPGTSSGAVVDLPLNGRNYTQILAIGPNTLGGTIVDPAGAVIPGANVVVSHVNSGLEYRAVTNGNGEWQVQGVVSGRLTINASRPGFNSREQRLDYDAAGGHRVNFQLAVGSASESVSIEANASRAESKQIERDLRQNAAAAKKDEGAASQGASQNVMDLQQRVVGVLPIAVNVPRTGNAYRFARPLVMDEETRLTFSYRAK